MITVKDLQEAIAECQGTRNPTASTCIKLAAYYTILDQMEKKSPNEDVIPAYSGVYSSKSALIDSESEFAQIVNGKEPGAVWALMDELMQTIKVVNPRLYASVLRKLDEM